MAPEELRRERLSDAARKRAKYAAAKAQRDARQAVGEQDEAHRWWRAEIAAQLERLVLELAGVVQLAERPASEGGTEQLAAMERAARRVAAEARWLTVRLADPRAPTASPRAAAAGE